LRKHTANNSRGENLREQDRINLPNERIPDLEATLAHGYSILEIVWNVSEAGLVVDSSGAGAGLGRFSAAEKRLSIAFGASVGRLGGRVGRRRLRIIRHG